MATRDDFKKRKPSFAILANSMYGEGKTHFGMTFPKVFYIGFEPNGIDILYRPQNKALLDNLVEYEYVIPSNDADLKAIFDEGTEKDGYKKGLIYRHIKRAKELAAEGKVETLFIDNVTYLGDMQWNYINTFHKSVSQRTGEIDTQSMYNQLGLFLDRLFLMEVLTFPGNVVASCHLKRESEEAMEGKKQRAGKVDKLSDIYPNVLGSFRDKIAGKFGASIYLERKIQGATSQFIAYCQKTRAFGTVIYAKNRYGLPTVVEGISYQTLMKANETKQEVQ